MNGVSKKLCMTAVSIAAIAQMAGDAEYKLPYAIIVGVICLVYKLIQGFIDWQATREPRPRLLSNLEISRRLNNNEDTNEAG